MLKEASIEELITGKISRKNGHIVVCMHHYPRHLKKELRDEYLHTLAPDEKLFSDFRAMREKLADHNVAFRLVRYEERFRLSAEALAELQRLTELSQSKDVYLVCQCGHGERCHRDLLLLLAKHRFGATTTGRAIAYPVFERCINHAKTPPKAPTPK